MGDSLRKKTLILCLGNEIISDDGFGPAVADRLTEAGVADDDTEVVFAPLAGFALLQLLEGRDRVLVIDTIRSRKSPPGTLYSFPADVFTPSRNLTTSHQINLPTAVGLGRKLGIPMPDRIDVLAVEAEDLETLREEMTPAVSEAVSEAVDFIMNWLSNVNNKERSLDT